MSHEVPGDDIHGELRSALFVAQYEAVRQVVLHARQTQHSIVSWSTAAAGVLLASGVVLAGDGTRKITEGTSGLAFMLLFGVAIPALAASSFNSWIGEVARMRRAAWFLRELEYNIYLSGPSSWPPPPVYDTIVARGPDGKGTSVTRVGRKAVTALYSGLYVLAVTIALWAVWKYEFPTSVGNHVEVVATLLALAGAGGFAWSVRQGYAAAAPYGTQRPRIHTQDFLASLFTASS